MVDFLGTKVEKKRCTASGMSKVDYMLATTYLFCNIVIAFEDSHIDDFYHSPLICQLIFQQIIKEKSAK